MSIANCPWGRDAWVVYNRASSFGRARGIAKRPLVSIWVRITRLLFYSGVGYSRTQPVISA
eukprot:8911380-Pyramimonas_sp.AAC.1